MPMLVIQLPQIHCERSLFGAWPVESPVPKRDQDSVAPYPVETCQRTPRREFAPICFP